MVELKRLLAPNLRCGLRFPNHMLLGLIVIQLFGGQPGRVTKAISPITTSRIIASWIMLKLCRPCMAMPWNMVVQRIFGWFRCISERFYQNIPEPVPPNVGGFNTLPHPINTTSQTWPYGSCMEGMTLGLTTQDRQEETSANVALPKSWKCKSRHFESEKKTWISWIHSHSKPLDASDGSNWRLRAWIIWIWIWVSPGQIPPSTRIDHPITITSPLDFGAKRLAVRHPDILRSLRSLEALQYLQTRSKISKLYYPSGFIQPDLSWFNQKLFKSCTF